jgi:predicted ATPase
LVIDNCEHLIEPVAALIDSWLRACPDVHVLATSREGLAVPGEVLWRVPSLRVDDDAAAVELFADRARLVQPGFAVDDDNIAAIADLCARLDGIPLAIELATARLKMFSLDQIAEHLGDRFRLLTGGSRVAVERQRTLKAMTDWSYDLLSDQERAFAPSTGGVLRRVQRRGRRGGVLRRGAGPAGRARSARATGGSVGGDLRA